VEELEEKGMPKFKVLRPIERDGKLYLPDGNRVPEKAKSACNGQEAAIDASGIIELSNAQAAEMMMGQIQAISTQQSAPSAQRARRQKAEG
jgi:hypothetical protein